MKKGQFPFKPANVKSFLFGKPVTSGGPLRYQSEIFIIFLQRFILDYKHIEVSIFFRDIATDFTRAEVLGWLHLEHFFSSYNSSLLNI